MSEVSFDDNQKAIMFKKLPLKTVSLSFTGTGEKEKTQFFINIITFKKLPIIPIYDLQSPQELKFMPVYSSATQFINYNSPTSPFTGVDYLSHNNPDEISNFYLTNMPSFGWKLIKKEPHSGAYSFFEWLKIVDPFTKIIPSLRSQGYAELVPPLKLNGQTLTFEQGSKACTITIYKFEDIVEKARQQTLWDVSVMEKYGDTVIAVFYFY
jgi:hypothetical protein